jgi:alanine racemase
MIGTRRGLPRRNDNRGKMMTLSRREVLAGLVSAPLLGSLGVARGATAVSADRFDPWLEIDATAFGNNVQTISKLAGGRPILAVIKNNAYGLGLTTVAPILEPNPAITGFAVVKTDEALALREAGISKPILLLGLFADSDGPALAKQRIQFSVCTDDAAARIEAAGKAAGTRPEAQFYLDTGMGRMGVPYHRAMPVMEDANSRALDIRGTFMGFTESDFDIEQLRRFRELTKAAAAGGIELGALHAASSHAVFNLDDSHLDQVRPGIAMFGAYPTNEDAERRIAPLVPAFRLCARVVRVEKLRRGDSVSYGRNYVASEPVWTATIPTGHTDGYPRAAVDGARVLVNGRVYPVIGAVSASHTIIEVGTEKTVETGDVATLVGPDHDAIHPNAVAAATATSVYDRLMHLSPVLPKFVV